MRSGCLLALLVILAVPRPAIAQCAENQSAASALAKEGDALRARDLDAAIAKYVEATKLAPDAHRIWWKLALAHERKNEWQAEVEACEAAEAAAERVEGKKAHADYYFREGYALEELAAAGRGDWARAQRAFQTALLIDPKLAEAWGEMAWTQLHLDDEAEALRSWTSAIRLDPASTSYYVILADEYRRLLLFKEEEQVLREGLSFASANDKHAFNLHALMGDLRETKGDFAAAAPEYEAAVASCAADHCSAHREGYFYLGVAYGRLGPPRRQQALEQLDLFVKLACGNDADPKYADQCTQAREFARRLATGEPL